MEQEKKIEKKQPTMSVVLAHARVTELARSLKLTEEQERKARATALELSSNPNLIKCSPTSLVKYCFETARYNFKDPRAICPVPYNNYIQAQVTYIGFRELAYRSGKYAKIDAAEVKECDCIKRDSETGQIRITFETEYFKTIGKKTIGYYAYAKDMNGVLIDSIFMSVEEIDQHARTYSKTYGSGAWKTSPIAMAKKTVIKKLCNVLDKTEDMRNLIEQDQIVYTDKGQEYLDNPNKNNTVEIKPDNSIIGE